VAKGWLKDASWKQADIGKFKRMATLHLLNFNFMSTKLVINIKKKLYAIL